MLNYLGLNERTIEYVVDKNVHKHCLLYTSDAADD